MIFVRTEDADREQLVEEDFWVAGAELADSIPSDFSGFGPSFDGRVKPDVASMGYMTTYVSTWCFNNMDSVTQQMVPTIEAGHIYTMPDMVMGYGIPDFYRAYLENRDTTISISENQLLHDVTVFPNPCHNQFSIRNTSAETQEVAVFDMTGRMVFSKNIDSEEVVNTEEWANGMYLLLAKSPKGWSEAIKIIRQ